MKLSSSSKKLLIRVFLFLFYIILGATVFMFIEQANERRERAEAQKFVALRENFTKLCGNCSREDITDFLVKLKHALRYGYDVDKDELKGAKWTFMNSFYFVGNIVTTIGYGHMVPETTGGRLFCIVYALFGIPLTALMLRSVGSRITEWIIAMIKSFDRRVYNRETENAEIKSAVIAFGLLWLIILLPAVGYKHLETNWEYLDSVYYCFITFSTIGFGDLVPNTIREQSETTSQVFVEFADLLYLVIGLTIMSSVIVSISSVIENKTQLLVDPMEAFRRIDMENLNSVAIKKLGLKMNGAGGDRTMSNGQMRRSSELPNGHINRRSSRLANWEENKMQERNSADRIDHVGPAPVISIARQPTISRTADGSSVRNGENNLVVPGIDIAAGSPSITPQPPPVFKSNKITPASPPPPPAAENAEAPSHGQVNTYCETVDEQLSPDEKATARHDDETTDESSVAGLYDLQDEHERIMEEIMATGSFKLRPQSLQEENEV